ncbi:helix-turn-helix domain-containing protein [Goodfellowiella coeruleoviolacea]|uniref:Helix-turn-helix domain-containing protein n=1 Tax=Goodfellowiella coeruleoviolacea TaxID=334858 RepID=A0AAE3GIK5_9PSEU|nr:helix-turn-helix transcriptional regulator [Goodfellowiella coeruleoviolacea]MCP2168014.1 Helix-turn-helix domain-containing protein [Goodfellowiella coeruleoviolacea]
MVNARPTVERRQLGLALKRLREQAGRSQLEAARHIGKDVPRISKVEDGLSTLSADELDKLLDLYGTSGSDRETIVTLGLETRRRQPRRAYTDLLPGSFQRFADLEAAASTMYYYESGVVPGLLQSPGYVNALFAAADSVLPEPSEAIRRNRTSFRFRRQETIWQSRKRKELHFVIGEAALDDVTGNVEVMREQLAHLLDIIDTRPHAEVRLLPRTVPDNPARGGGLTLLEFGASVPRIGFASVVYGPSTYYDDPGDTGAMLRNFQRLNDLSLSVADTRKSISRKLERLTADAQSKS